jgi:rod shape determining protein RodA
VQPAEFAKLAVILALASWLRLRTAARWFDNLWVPVGITALPAILVMRQPDLSSSLVFWPILFAMVYAAGASLRQIAGFAAGGAVVVLLAWLFLLHDYQLERIEAWRGHFAWQPELSAAAMADATVAERDARREELQRIRDAIRGPAYQPWQSLIAIGSGGWTGFGVGAGPQNRYDFLPYRFDDYVFAVVAEETGWLGAVGLLALYATIVVGLFGIALRTRERFGRLVVVGVATYLGTQALVHTAVCTWLVPATGLPMPLVSYGGSGTLTAAVALGLAFCVGAHREPVLGSVGFA